MKPVELIKKLKEEKTDALMGVFGDDYIAMIKTLDDVLEPHGYELSLSEIDEGSKEEIPGPRKTINCKSKIVDVKRNSTNIK